MMRLRGIKNIITLPGNLINIPEQMIMLVVITYTIADSKLVCKRKKEQISL